MQKMARIGLFIFAFLGAWGKGYSQTANSLRTIHEQKTIIQVPLNSLRSSEITKLAEFYGRLKEQVRRSTEQFCDKCRTAEEFLRSSNQKIVAALKSAHELAQKYDSKNYNPAIKVYLQKSVELAQAFSDDLKNIDQTVSLQHSMALFSHLLSNLKSGFEENHEALDAFAKSFSGCESSGNKYCGGREMIPKAILEMDKVAIQTLLQIYLNNISIFSLPFKLIVQNRIAVSIAEIIQFMPQLQALLFKEILTMSDANNEVVFLTQERPGDLQPAIVSINNLDRAFGNVQKKLSTIR